MAARLNESATPDNGGILTAIMLGLIRAYQWGISPWLGPRCRFQPTCSEYAAAAIRRFGPLHGGWLALKRIGRCHPWGSSGYDPVPDISREDRKVK